jgi:SAM-dependent methyltransferase
VSRDTERRRDIRTNSRLLLAGTEISSNQEMLALYEARIAQHGMTPETMFYQSPSQHASKLAAIAFVLRNYLKSSETLIDAGCGYGELGKYLHDVRYLGVELSKTMVGEASRRNQRREIICADVSNLQRVSDWVVLAGVVNSVPNPGELLSAAWRVARRGLVADFLVDGRLPPKFQDLNRFAIYEVVTHFWRLGAKAIEIAASSKYWSIVVAWKDWPR